MIVLEYSDLAGNVQNEGTTLQFFAEDLTLKLSFTFNQQAPTNTEMAWDDKYNTDITASFLGIISSS